MRYGIFSDVHGNLEALNAVIEECQRQGVRRMYCLGDIVGYGANPRESVEIIRNECALSVAGNHDWALLGKINTDRYALEARKALEFHKQQLDEEHIQYLKGLKLTESVDDFQLVHATLNKPDQFLYLKDIRDSADTFYLMQSRICFVGHTHVPSIFIKQGTFTSLSQTVRAKLHGQARYIVNVGSVGQPRDGEPKASMCIYDPDLERVEIVRVQYDIRLAHKKIYDAGYPESLASRLLIGQ